MRQPANSALVYSTDSGRMCPTCRRPKSACVCKGVCKAVDAGASAKPGDGIVRVSCETKGRGGKAVTIVRGLGLESAALGALGKRLRAACGTGGTTKGGDLELQGDHRDRVVEMLVGEGRVVKRAGG